MMALADGSYDIIVVDAQVIAGDGDEGPGQVTTPLFVRLDLAITAGPAKGDIVTVRLSNHGDSPDLAETDALDALGTPGLLQVVNGEPTVTLEH